MSFITETRKLCLLAQQFVPPSFKTLKSHPQPTETERTLTTLLSPELVLETKLNSVSPLLSFKLPSLVFAIGQCKLCHFLICTKYFTTGVTALQLQSTQITIYNPKRITRMNLIELMHWYSQYTCQTPFKALNVCFTRRLHGFLQKETTKTQ